MATLVVDDQFVRGAYPTAANAAGGTNVGPPDTVGTGSWIDTAGNVWVVSAANTLTGTSGNGAGWNATWLKRPSGEQIQDCSIVGYVAQGSNDPALHVRLQSNGDSYFLFDMNRQPILYKDISGAATNLHSSGFSYTAGHTYKVELKATGVSPTSLVYTVYDVTSSTLVYTSPTIPTPTGTSAPMAGTPMARARSPPTASKEVAPTRRRMRRAAISSSASPARRAPSTST
ncbi:MAG: hypothetical protein LC769_03035 [Chloroflexi bacterium]|nr:hypothetical protein [Chloroflexota bacterium]